MKSRPPENKTTQTSCKDCIFAVYENNTQVNCLQGRISTFKKLNMLLEAYDEEKEFWVVNRLCNTHRSIEWNNGIIDIDQAQEEIKLIFDLIIDCNYIDEEYISYLDELLISIKRYGIEKFNINLIHSGLVSPEQKHLIASYMQKIPNAKIKIYLNEELIVTGLIQKSKTSYFTVIKKNNPVDINVFERLNYLVNQDMKKILYAKNNNNALISTLAFKIQNMQQDTNFNFDVTIKAIMEYSQPEYYVEV
jgi:hypothetical protein